MNVDFLYKKALNCDPLNVDEGLFLYLNGRMDELMYVADSLRQIHVPGNKAGWIIDRNVNTTNICYSQCLFCNFCRKINSKEGYVTTIEQYRTKINELIKIGGNQLLLQGGMNPRLDLSYYTSLFSELKQLYPNLKLHALGPPEIVFLAKKEGLPIMDTLVRLVESGLDSLPGAGAEILSDRVRKIISPAKASVEEWSDVMICAHKLNLPTSATMMYGHIETLRERIEHLDIIREIQTKKNKNHHGFITFIPWPFQDKGTFLKEKMGIKSNYQPTEYLRTIAISRIMLNNIKNIQASILTVGKETGAISLHAGANDLGSVMIEENVVSSAGSNYFFDSTQIPLIIKEAGFEPILRDQKYKPVNQKNNG